MVSLCNSVAIWYSFYTLFFLRVATLKLIALSFYSLLYENVILILHWMLLFMILFFVFPPGKKNYLPPTQLVMGFGFMWKVTCQQFCCTHSFDKMPLPPSFKISITAWSMPKLFSLKLVKQIKKKNKTLFHKMVSYHNVKRYWNNWRMKCKEDPP